MTTAILKMKKTTKTAKMKNETLLRAKTMHRAAILLKQVSDPTRPDSRLSACSPKESAMSGGCATSSTSASLL